MAIKLRDLKAEARLLTRAGELGGALAAYDHILGVNPLDYDSRLKIEALWPDDAQSLDGGELLDRLTASLAVVESKAAEVVRACRENSVLLTPPWVLIDDVFGSLDDEALERVMDVFDNELKGSGVTAEDYPRFVKLAYEQEAPKPKDAKDAKEPPKEIPQAEMESFLLERVTLGKEELEQLAARRLERVRQYLIATGQLPPDRLLAASTQVAANDSSGTRRVNFTLK